MTNTQLAYYKTHCEDAVLQIDTATDNITAIYWGIPADRQSKWIADIESGDAHNYADLSDHLIDEIINIDDWVARTPGARCVAASES